MKKDKLFISFRIFVTVCAAWGWWGVLYPELTMTPDTYCIIYEETGAPTESYVQEQVEMVEWKLDNDIYETVLGAERSQIRFRSRLLTNITAFCEQERGINESGK